MPEHDLIAASVELGLLEDPITEPDGQSALNRETFIGGTDAVRIAGLSPFGGAYAVWLEKIRGFRPAITQEHRRALRLGQYLEGYVADVLQEDLGEPLRPGEFVQDAEVPYFGGNVDRFTESGIPVEIKTYGFNTDISNGPPIYWKAQLQWYVGISGKDHGILATYARHSNDLTVFRVSHDPDLYDYLRSCAVDFWERYVEGGEEPPIDDSATAEAYLAQAYPSANPKKYVESCEAIEALAARAQHLAERYAEIAMEYQTIVNRIKAYMQDAHALRTERGVFQWYDVQRGTFSLPAFKQSLIDVGVPPELVEEAEAKAKQYVQFRVFRAPWKSPPK